MRAAALYSNKNSKDGFTLVEVIASMFILGMVFTAAFSSYMLGMNMINDAREEVRASQIIQSEIERLRTKNWSQLNGLADGATFQPSGEFSKLYADKYTAFRYLIDINSTDQMLVAVRVEWTNSAGRTSVRWFNTIFTENGLNDYYYRKL